LATTLPLLIGRLLDREDKLKRGRFREETMTDIFTGALAAFAGPELVMRYPVEDDTGGDIDLHFWHVATGTNLYLRVQAKRLNARMHAGNPVKIAHRSYNELLHKPYTKTKFQFETLVATPAPWVSLYMFYNHERVVKDPHFARTSPTVRGINLAFASDIATELNDKLAAAKATPKQIKHHKRLSHLRKHFFGLDAILCPSGDWEGALVPSPTLVAASLKDRYMAVRKVDGPRAESEEVFRYLSLSEQLSTTREAIVQISDGPAVRIDRQLERPMLTFISGRTSDSRTPRISMHSDVLDG
jgi:hypothetical protein